MLLPESLLHSATFSILAAFVAITLWAIVGSRPGWDDALLEQALGHRPAELRDAMLALARVSNGLGVAIVSAGVVGWLLLSRRFGDALFVAVAASGGGDGH